MRTYDLFPETLLVTLIDGKPATTSWVLAQQFKKSHRNVVRDIEVLLKKCAEAEISLLKFEQSEFKNARGKVYKTYVMDRDAFLLLVMGYSDSKSLRVKWNFICAFNAMEVQFLAQTLRYAAALDQVRPNLRPVVEGTQAGLTRAAIAGPLGKSCASITYHRRQGKSLGLLLAGGAA